MAAPPQVAALTKFALNIAVILYTLQVIFQFVSAQYRYSSRMTFDYGEVLHSVIIMSIGLGVAFFASYGDVMSVIQFSGSNGENYQVWQNIARSIVAIVVGVGVLYVFVNVTWTVARAQAAKMSGRPQVLGDLIVKFGGVMIGAAFTIMASTIAAKLVDGIAAAVR